MEVEFMSAPSRHAAYSSIIGRPGFLLIRTNGPSVRCPGLAKGRQHAVEPLRRARSLDLPLPIVRRADQIRVRARGPPVPEGGRGKSGLDSIEPGRLLPVDQRAIVSIVECAPGARAG